MLPGGCIGLIRGRRLRRTRAAFDTAVIPAWRADWPCCRLGRAGFFPLTSKNIGGGGRRKDKRKQPNHEGCY